MEIVTGVGREISARGPVEPKVSYACHATRPAGDRYARWVGGYASNLKFLQQIIHLVIKPTIVAWLPYNVSRKAPTKQRQELPRADGIKFETRR